MGFLLHTMKIIFQIKRDAKYTTDPTFYETEGTALMLAMVGILVAGMFINRPYAEVIYWLSAFAVALRNIQYDEIAVLEEQTELDANEMYPAEITV